MALLKGLDLPVDQQLLVEGALIELRLVKLGIPYEAIATMDQGQVEVYLGAAAAIEEKEAQDQANAERSARLKGPR